MIFQIFLFLAGMYFLKIIMIEYYNNRVLAEYKKKGLKTIYKSVYGFNSYFEDKQKNRIILLKKVLGKFKQKSLYIFNKMLEKGAFVIISDEVLIKKILKLEEKIFFRENLLKDEHSIFGFLYDNSSFEMKTQKMIVKKIFCEENLKKIEKFIASRIDRNYIYLLENKDKNGEWQEIDIKKFFENLYKELTVKLIFGLDNIGKYDSLFKLSEEICTLFFDKIPYSELNLFTFGYLEKFNLLPDLKQLQRKITELKKKLKKEIIQKNSKKKNFFYLLQNETELDKNSLERIAQLFLSTFYLLKISKNFSINSLINLSNKLTTLKKIQRKETSIDVILRTVIAKETPPIFLSRGFHVMEDLKINGIEFNEDDEIVINNFGRSFNQENSDFETKISLKLCEIFLENFLKKIDVRGIFSKNYKLSESDCRLHLYGETKIMSKIVE